MDISKDLIAASSTPLILSILEGGDSYGYAIIKRVAELSSDRVTWKDGMLYPVLHRLEEQGLIAAYWKEAESGRRRKYYRLNRNGKRELAAQREQWSVIIETLRNSWDDANRPRGGSQADDPALA